MTPQEIIDKIEGNMVSVSVEGGTFDRKQLKDFYISRYLMTQDIWEAVMGSNPSFFTGNKKKRPIELVSWNDCQECL